MNRLTLLFALTALVFALGAGCRSEPDAPEAQDTPDVPTLDEIQAHLEERRALNIERLRAYREAGVYPRNRVVDAQANVFVDEDGHHCAVANLMRLDGETDLIAQTAANNNLVVLADVHDGPLNDWMLNSGFTRAEIARIQEPYMPWEGDDPNFGQVEDNRLNDHFVEVDRELQLADARDMLAAARAQRAQILADTGGAL